MTNAEAREELITFIGTFECPSLEAVEVAIEALQTPPITQRSMYQAGYRQGREDALKREPSDDLISRTEALEALGEEPPVWCDEEYEIAERNQWREDVEAIKSVPSADRPKGKWIYWREDGIKRCKCSRCLTSYGCLDTPYCPNCGEKMVEGRSEE